MRVILGAGIGVFLGFAVAFMIDPAVASQYVALVRSDYVWNYTSAAGGMLGSLFSSRSHALQSAPMLPGTVTLLWYWWKNGSRWNWREHLPTILILSVLTAAYGWPFDEVVLLVPMVAFSAQCTHSSFMRNAALAWSAANFIGCLAVVLRYGDAAGMMFCAMAVLAFLILNNAIRGTAEKNLEARLSSTGISRGHAKEF